MQVFNHFPGDTNLSYKTYTKLNNDTTFEKIWLTTPECQGDHKYTTIAWMKHSLFCLQPPGDSPTRKSFYDALLSGCIPVLFKTTKTLTVYPFEDWLDYTQFTVTINATVVRKENGIFEHLKTFNKNKIEQMQQALAKAAPQLQYNYPLNNLKMDAVDGILKQIGVAFNHN